GDPDAGPAARRRLGFGAADFVVLCFGFIAPYKGLETALEAARLAGPPVRLVVAGGEHPRLRGREPYVGGLRERWGAWARFTGPVPDAEVAAWFAAADVALLPYPRPFSSSGVLADALAHRTPVLVSPALAACIGAAPECTAPAEPSDLADRLRALAGSRSRLAALQAGAALLARGRSWPSVAHRHLELYEEVTLGAGSSGRCLRAG
ncbi:MAG TPA: glycosyltransferase, partial [Acidimicrobiales bacterium]